MINFTKDELYEIEKTFDHKAGEVISYSAQLLEKFHNSGDTVLFKKVLDESVKNFDAFRTISAKCELARK